MRFVSNAVHLAHRLAFVVIFLSLGSIASLGQVQLPASTAAPVSASGAQSSVPGTPRLSMAPGGDASIRLGSGDLVEISVYDVPDLSTKNRVNETGDLDLPLINTVHVEGLTVSEAEQVIEKRLQEGGFVRDPHVQVFVDEYTSDAASLLGEVARPGVYPVLGEQSLFNMISAAGGLSDRAGKSITITHRDRPDKPETVVISHNLEDHPESNVAVYAGDTIMVRRADVIYVVGEVSRPSGFLMDNNNHLTVLQAIALAGGTDSNAKLNGARILRKGPDGVSEIPVQLKKLLEAKSSDIPLQAEDILFVPTSARKILGSRTAEAALQMATAVSIVAIRP